MTTPISILQSEIDLAEMRVRNVVSANMNYYGDADKDNYLLGKLYAIRDAIQKLEKSHPEVGKTSTGR